MTAEGKLKDKVKELLIERGAWYYMPVPMGYGRKGIPDFLVCYRGQFIGIETKAPAKEAVPKPWQGKELQAICDANGVAFWPKTIAEVKNILDGIDKCLDFH